MTPGDHRSSPLREFVMSIRLAAVAALAAALFALAFAGFNQAASTAGAPAAEADASGFTAGDEARIKEIVANYIRENPEILIEALNAYAEGERTGAARDNLPFLLSDQGGFSAGPNVSGAKVAVIEFFDYHCGFCKRANGLVRDLTRDDADVKVVFRELPILREESEAAAKIALAAREQGKYLDLHFALMSAKGVITEARALEIAEKEGLDPAKLKKAAKATALDENIERNQRAAAELGVDGTPSFVVASLEGDYLKIVTGFDPDAVLSAVKEAKAAAQ